MHFYLSLESIFVGSVVAITFGGLLIYLIRTDIIARRLEHELRALEAEKSAQIHEDVIEPLAKP